MSGVFGSASSKKRPVIQRVRMVLELKRVDLLNASRPAVKTLNSFILCAFVGNSNALVGSSGCGESTDVSLIKSFYETMILPWVMVITMYKYTRCMYNTLFVNVFYLIVFRSSNAWWA
ncbi:hypothetical protein HanPI659440_Chr11g0408021 [Helianthus annuus]|nr:hypothetical protein HanPI659440_Chr11g0408021 [Helianthus annuus]